ncbi:MAG: SDR family NAD(P)-dependent oxidoreductase [Ignavibacteria bacterium]|jgi:NAD(P)-dependent dehydrogenase (short-subunit alcohol dehydrogenase family)
MSKIFITGSSDGLGMMAAKSLIKKGHKVVLHSRNSKRAADVSNEIPNAADVLIGDLSNFDESIKLAEQVNSLGSFDVVIHNAGVYQTDAETIFRVNVLAPYILTCLIEKPKRLIYLSSDMHYNGRAKLNIMESSVDNITYSDSKLLVTMFSNTVAREWPEVLTNAVDPGWVLTKMGGSSATDDLDKGYETQVWLAESDNEKAKVTGRYFYHKEERKCNPEANNIELQNEFLNICKKITGISFP